MLCVVPKLITSKDMWLVLNQVATPMLTPEELAT